MKDPIERLHQMTLSAGLTTWSNDQTDRLDFAGPLNLRFFWHKPSRHDPENVRLMEIIYPVEFRKILNEPVSLAVSSDLERLIRTWSAITRNVSKRGSQENAAAAVMEVYHFNHYQARAGEETYTFEQCCEIVRRIPDKKLRRAACAERRIPWAELSDAFQTQAKLGLCLEMFSKHKPN